MASELIGSGGGQGTAAQQVQGNVANATTDSGNPVKTGGVYNSSAPTYTTGQRADTQSDVNGNTKETLATLIAGEDLPNNVLKTEQRFSYQNVAAGTATTVIKSAAGFLHTLTINTKGASSNTLTVYDNTAGSGTKIATIDTTANVGTLIFDCSFGTGLTVVSATGTGADFTVIYR